MHNREKLAYLAGIIDGEGSIAISPSGSRPSYPYNLYPRLRVGNTDLGLIEWLANNFGGSYGKTGTTNGRHKRLYNWTITGQAAIDLLTTVRPWLLVKQQQAWLSCEFWAQRNTTNTRRDGVSGEEKALREGFLLASRYLNQRGVSNA